MEEKSTQVSRSIAVLIIIATLVVLSAVVPARWIGGAPPLQTKPKLDLSALTSVKEVANDSNHDGVITWKEVMTETLNPSPATIAELKKIPVDQKSVDELNDPNNLTSSFSKNLYLAAAYLDKNGITDEQSKQDALTKLLQDEKAKIVPTTYGYKNVLLAKTESKESIRAYGNTIASLLGEALKPETLKANTYSIISYSENKDPSLLKDLQTNTTKLNALFQKLLAVPTPPSALIYQIMILNKVSAYKDVVTAFSNADTDPLRATILLETYPNTIISLTRLYSTLGIYFDEKNIVFTAKEAGYIFTTGYSITN